MTNNGWVDTMARLGLTAKGVVYTIIGVLIVLSVTKGKGDAKVADKGGVFQFIEDLPAGTTLLTVVVIGLICYTIWRFIQAFRSSDDDISVAKRIRYAISGLAYGGFSFYGIKFLNGNKSSGESGNKEAA